MAARIVIRQKGLLRDLTAPKGTLKVLGAVTTAEELILEEHDAPPAEFPDSQFLTHMIGISKGTSPCSVFWKENGIEMKSAVQPGTIFLSTAKRQSGIRWDGRYQTLVLSIGIETMERALPEPFTKSPVELITLRAGAPDRGLEHLVGALNYEFERNEPSARILLETLGNATAFYLAQRYGATPAAIHSYKSGLSRERLSRVVDYIDAHLDNDLSVLELANVAFLSQYHFGKMFKRSTGQNPHQYVTNRRIERAGSLLRTGKLTLSQIAFAVGFQDQSQFTTIFKRYIGTTPGEYRLENGPKFLRV
jgi:AraC family transcriptional regulator